MRATIKLKLAVTFVVVILLSGISAVVAIHGLGALRESVDELVDVAAQQVSLSEKLDVNLLALVRAEKNMILADNATDKTHVVGEKKPNRWGLFDLYGNVSEWCEDVYSPAYYQESPPADPHGPPNPGKDVKRVMRGGSWKASADMCRATVRQGERTGDSDACFFTDYCGFRCVRRATPEELQQLKKSAKP